MDGLVMYFNQIHGKHEGQPAIIICGGPSAPEQLKKVRSKLKDPVLISVNEHGCKLTKCDYSISLDNIHKKMVDCDTQKITPYNWADIKLTGHWNASNSGRTACWVAWKLGCTPVVLVGADLYQTGTYWWDKKAHSSGNNTRLPNHIKEWEVVPHRVPAEILTCAGGPLVEAGVIQKFDARRKYPAVEYKDPERDKRPKKNAPPGQKVRVKRCCWIEGQQYAIGEEAVVRARSARQVVNAQKAVYVN